MSLLSINDLKFIELISSTDSEVRGGSQWEILIGLLPIGVLPSINPLIPDNDDSVTDNGTVTQDSQATASFSGDKGGSTQTYTSSS
jgi:hypothetical protein